MEYSEDIIINKFKHKTVFLEEAVDMLNIKPNGIYIDATFGCGGHSYLILSKLNKFGKLYVIDRDPFSIFLAKKIIDSRLFVIHDRFSKLINYVKKYSIFGKIDGILFDLGMSSLQLNEPNRGFSFMRDGFLDMRMDYFSSMSAFKFLFFSDSFKITHILKKYGEERYAKLIANKIVEYNKISILKKTSDLSKLISSVVFNKTYKHPSTRTFQAIRIYINNELYEITEIFKYLLSILNIGGRICVISFHSLEDRIVKNFMNKYGKRFYFPYKLPILDSQIRDFNIMRLKVFKKIFPTKRTILLNSRSRSAILRSAEKII
ncbi:16S rRNA (cytosine(1402)-N(4))-methyltransferase RsmH [Candidatus Purcelliella pentastirinorum]|uniref:16S rRNA (cytosine(1402)-N(4))-methyltransferase RsmH n=1 Tax=Candidatus Purcelliella pentastirinorum TaxID=472834 RepID=UPI0039F69EC6